MLQITEKIKNQTYEISLKSTGLIVGEFVKVDGFYYYSQGKKRVGGLFSQEFLESLTRELQKLNKELNDSIDEYVKQS
jgi:hypothetical protein